jgi:hypothetical protein
MKLSEKLQSFRADRPDEWTMDEFIRDAKQLEAEAEWQPIEIAPKDGTYILLWEQYSDNPFVGCYLDYSKSWSVSHEHVDAEGGWEGAIVVDRLTMPITHWMPLPKEPASPEHKGGDTE